MMIGEYKSLDIKRDNYFGESLVVNGTIYIVKGHILGNPFSKRIENSEAAHWILSNRYLVEKTIEIQLRKHVVIGGNVGDCFNLLINEFNTRLDLQFNKNYFGKDSGYTIGDYVLSRVKYVVQRYKNEIMSEDSVPFLTTDETNRHFYGVMDEGVESGSRVEDIVDEDSDYWDGLFNKLIFNFGIFLEERLYKDLDKELLIALLYFDVGDFGDTVNTMGHYEKVAKKSSESVDVITTIVEDMVKAVKTGDHHGKEILRIVQELLEGKRFGWTPLVLRKQSGN